MSDTIDDANHQADLLLNESMRVRKFTPRIEPSGCCYNCGETIDKSRRWCDAHCRDIYQKENGRD